MNEVRDRERMRRARLAANIAVCLVWMPLWLLSWQWDVFDLFAWLAGLANIVFISVWLATVAYWALGKWGRP